eukprot:s7974_g2.t1
MGPEPLLSADECASSQKPVLLLSPNPRIILPTTRRSHDYSPAPFATTPRPARGPGGKFAGGCALRLPATAPFEVPGASSDEPSLPAAGRPKKHNKAAQADHADAKQLVATVTAALAVRRWGLEDLDIAKNA